MFDTITMIVQVTHERTRFDTITLNKANNGPSHPVNRSNRTTVKNPTTGQSLQVRSLSNDELYIDGSLYKFLQGHNIHGTRDLKALVLEALRIIFSVIGIQPTDEEQEKINNGKIKLIRVDMVGVVLAINQEHKIELFKRIKSLLPNLVRSFASEGYGSTLYISKISKVETCKIYDKLKEINDNRSNKSQPALKKIEQGDRNKLNLIIAKHIRIELTRRQKKLARQGLDLVEAWDIETSRDILAQYIEKTLSPMNQPTRNYKKLSLSKITQSSYRSTYINWLNNENLLQILGAKTFKNHKSYFLSLGINISLPYEEISHIPLNEVFNANNLKMGTCKALIDLGLNTFNPNKSV